MLPCCPKCNRCIRAEYLAASELVSIKYDQMREAEGANKPPPSPELVQG